jgi:hypothetical protein
VEEQPLPQQGRLVAEVAHWRCQHAVGSGALPPGTLGARRELVTHFTADPGRQVVGASSEVPPHRSPLGEGKANSRSAHEQGLTTM